jgi:monofunctional biosynthetic peptidoglycan transglycosylase
MGEGVYGVGQASRFYFGKSPSALTAKEGAFLAMLLPSPRKYAVSFRKRQLTLFARKRIRSILNKLVQAGTLTPEERDQEWLTPLSFEARAEFSIPKENDSDGDDETEGENQEQDLHSEKS